jgi:hypothetical protein
MNAVLMRWAAALGAGRECARRVGGKNIYTKAGGVLILNNASFHCVTQRKTALQRRAMHVRYRLPEPVHSRQGIVDPWESVAQYTAALPARSALRPPPTAKM